MRRVAFAAVMVVALSARAASLKLPVTADVGICAHPKEVHDNTGGKSRVRIKGNEHYYLFNFDVKRLRGRKITGATLHLKLAAGRLRRVATCTVPAAWVEGTAGGRPQRGSTCFTHVKYPTIAWTPGDGTMLDATFNSPYMMWRASDVRAGKNGWIEIPIAPELVQAVALGLSHGLVLSEERGQTRENHDVFTRHQSGAKPYLVVEWRKQKIRANLIRPPAKVALYEAASGLKSGAMNVDTSWNGKNLLASRVRAFEQVRGGTRMVFEQVTFAEPVVLLEGLKPAGGRDGGKWALRVESWIGPQPYSHQSPRAEQPTAVKTPRPRGVKAPDKMPRSTAIASGWRVDMLDPTDVAAGDVDAKGGKMNVPIMPRGAWVGFQILLTPAAGAYGKMTIELPRLIYAGPSFKIIRPLTCYYAYRLHNVTKDGKAHPEVLVPVKFGQELPTTTRRIWLDVWAPADATAGPYEGKLLVKQKGRTMVTAPIKLQVAEVTLPESFHIIGSMNTYGSPARAMGVREANAEAFMAMERKYYRLAHAHRMTLTVLPYSQSGGISWRGAPKIVRKEGKISYDWTQWDQRYGPLLSGETFSADKGYVGPGSDMPINHIYLPLHENWPIELAEHFKPWPPPKDYTKLLTWLADLPPIARSISGEMDWWNSPVNAFTNHVAKRGWMETQYQVYLNNKYLFRRGGGSGVSLWLLDEPSYADDFLALQYFGRLLSNAINARFFSHAQACIEFRVDISRPTHQRQWLDGLVDLNVCAGQLYSQRRLIAYRKRKFGETYWNYRMPPSFMPSNMAWSVWPVQSYCWGAGGTLPWQTIGSDGDLIKADATALMYPGRKFGVDGPLASLRMKAWRQGLQTAELLRMLRLDRRWTDVQLRAWVGQVCSLGGWKDGIDPAPDAPIVTFKGMTSLQLARLQRAAITELNSE